MVHVTAVFHPAVTLMTAVVLHAFVVLVTPGTLAVPLVLTVIHVIVVHVVVRPMVFSRSAVVLVLLAVLHVLVVRAALWVVLLVGTVSRLGVAVGFVASGIAAVIRGPVFSIVVSAVPGMLPAYLLVLLMTVFHAPVARVIHVTVVHPSGGLARHEVHPALGA